MVERGSVTAKKIEHEYYISKTEFSRIKQLVESYVPLDVVISELARETNSRFSVKKYNDKSAFVEMAIGEKWWDAEIIRIAEYPVLNYAIEYAVRRNDAQIIKEKCRLWMRLYGKKPYEQTMLLLQHCGISFPDTTKKLAEFAENLRITNKVTYYSVAGMISSILESMETYSKELDEFSEEELEKLVESTRERTIACRELLADFLNDYEYTKRVFRIRHANGVADTSAYSIAEFATITAAVVNMEIWENNSLIEKAVQQKKCADMWLYVALHVFSVCRGTDLERFQAPAIPFPAKEILKMIESGEYADVDARAVAVRFITAIRVRNLKPNKTRKYTNVPSLYIFCPESCMVSFGIILSIAAAHYELAGADSFVVRPKNKQLMKEFFGEAFYSACREELFSTRRANKALMQAVEYEANDGQKEKTYIAYLLAAIMRSHKGGYGQIPKTTERYLGDATISGYTPHFVIKQMFERGALSFLTDRLLANCYGDEYKSLRMPEKTELIACFGIDKFYLSNIIEQIDRAQDMAADTVNEVLAEMNAGGEKLILRRIIQGLGESKNENELCISKAAGLGCKCPTRLDCLGCRYEILSKAVLERYLFNYYGLIKEMSEEEVQSNTVEIKKREYLLNETIVPAIAEILLSLKNLADNTDGDIRAYSYLKEEIEAYFYGNDEHSKKRGLLV